MLGRHRRKTETTATGQDIELNNAPAEHHDHSAHAPHYNHKGEWVNHNGHKITKGIKSEGESGRKGVHPHHFLRIGFRSTSTASMLVNILWPFVPAAIAIHFARPELHKWIFTLNYIAMVPTANLIGFAGQELARKLPKVFGT